jgi:hypothetical protein
MFLFFSSRALRLAASAPPFDDTLMSRTLSWTLSYVALNRNRCNIAPSDGRFVKTYRNPCANYQTAVFICFLKYRKNMRATRRITLDFHFVL